MLCEICISGLNAHISKKPSNTKIIYRKTRKNKRVTHHETAESFVVSVQSDCFICTAVLRHTSLQELGLEEIKLLSDPDFPFSLMRCFFKDGDPAVQIVTHTGNDSYSGITRVEFRPYNEQQRRRIVREFSSAEADSIRLRLAKSWFNQCSQEHDCMLRAAKNTNFTPSRLLDISPHSESSSGSQWRVIETHNIKSAVMVFGTVSHRWTADTVKLTTQNLTQLQEFNDDYMLPQTFQIILQVARYLSINFLWIDCLCIIQDSKTDWLRESLLMEDIYRNSVCNFFVDGNSESSEPRSLLSTQSLKEVDLCYLNWKISPWDPRSWFKRAVKTKDCTYFTTHYDFWHWSLYDTELSKRGWVFQELMLSPISIHLYKDQLFWECKHLQACEYFPDGIHEDMSLSSALLHANMFRGVTEPNETMIEDTWHEFIQQYSLSLLTVPHDKLVAFAGIAKAFQSLRQDNYYAGLFGRHFPLDLLWEVGRGGIQSSKVKYKITRPDEYRAPSWSWASVEGPVHFDPYIKVHEVVELVQIRRIATKTLTDDTFGQVIGGQIELSGWLMLLKSQDSVKPAVVEYEGLPVVIVGEGITVKYDIENEENSNTILFLPLAVTKLASHPEYTIRGLLLAPAPKGGKLDFVRKGTLESNISYYKEGLSALGINVEVFNRLSWRLYSRKKLDITLY